MMPPWMDALLRHAALLGASAVIGWLVGRGRPRASAPALGERTPRGKEEARGRGKRPQPVPEQTGLGTPYREPESPPPPHEPYPKEAEEPVPAFTDEERDHGIWLAGCLLQTTKKRMLWRGKLEYWYDEGLRVYVHQADPVRTYQSPGELFEAVAKGRPHLTSADEVIVSVVRVLVPVVRWKSRNIKADFFYRADLESFVIQKTGEAADVYPDAASFIRGYAAKCAATRLE